MESTLVTAASAVVVATITGIFTWFAANRRGHKDFQGNLNDSFRLLIDELSKERHDARNEILALGGEIRILRNDVRRLENHIQNLEHILRSHNIEFKPINFGRNDS